MARRLPLPQKYFLAFLAKMILQHKKNPKVMSSMLQLAFIFLSHFPFLLLPTGHYSLTKLGACPLASRIGWINSTGRQKTHTSRRHTIFANCVKLWSQMGQGLAQMLLGGMMMQRETIKGWVQQMQPLHATLSFVSNRWEQQSSLAARSWSNILLVALTFAFKRFLQRYCAKLLKEMYVTALFIDTNYFFLQY